MAEVDLRTQNRRLVAAARAIARNVPKAYFVGGFVRDALLGARAKDADVEVYGVAPTALRRILAKRFGRVQAVGAAFGVYKVRVGAHEVDVSIPRTESKTGSGHRGFRVVGDPSLSEREAARRRDFTINSVLCHPVTGTITDPFGGVSDLHRRVLRVTDPTAFGDDPLRVLRAVQLAARLGLRVHPGSARLMRDMVARGDLDELSRERITAEIEKLLTLALRPSVGIRLGARLGVWDAVFPGCPVPSVAAWCRALDAAAARPRRSRVEMIAAFASGFDPSCRAAALKRLSIAKSEARLALQGPPRRPLLRGRDLLPLGFAPGTRLGEVIRSVEAERDANRIRTKAQAIRFAKTML